MKNLLKVLGVLLVMGGVMWFVLAPQKEPVYGGNGPMYGNSVGQSVKNPMAGDGAFGAMSIAQRGAQSQISAQGPMLTMKSAGAYDAVSVRSAGANYGGGSANGGGMMGGSAVAGGRSANGGNLSANGGGAVAVQGGMMALNMPRKDSKAMNMEDEEETVDMRPMQRVDYNSNAGDPAPLGDAAMPLMLMACIFVAYKRLK